MNDQAEPKGPIHTAPLRHVASDEREIRRVWLEVLAGPDQGKRIDAKYDRLVVGTHESADLRLADTTVSRFHCEILPGRDAARVRDLGSRNGTFVDGVSVIEAKLHDGAVISLGESRLRFEVGSDTVAVPVSARTRFGTMVGTSAATRRVFAVLERAAESDATVLLMGETGTGKEAAAESIHLESARRERPFVVVDCSAIPADLLESELFGHERGAFTGASQRRDGAFLEANGGTIFLDELGELPLALQPKLLRALEKRQVKRVGENNYRPIDVRVIAATNRDLKELVNQRAFRSDLYYRLAVLEVRLPPLRERLDDLPSLVDHLLDEQFSEAQTRHLRTPSFLASLASHGWPGNVRELRNYLARCVALREAVELDPDANEPPGAPELTVDPRVPFKEARDALVSRFEREYLVALLAAHAENVTAAARAAGMDRVYLYRLLWRHGLR